MLELSLRTCFWHMSWALGDVPFPYVITPALLTCLESQGSLSTADHFELAHVDVKHLQTSLAANWLH